MNQQFVKTLFQLALCLGQQQPFGMKRRTLNVLDWEETRFFTIRKFIWYIPLDNVLLAFSRMLRTALSWGGCGVLFALQCQKQVAEVL